MCNLLNEKHFMVQNLTIENFYQSLLVLNDIKVQVKNYNLQRETEASSDYIK